MSFESLPEEIIIQIIQLLDTKSVKCLYGTCQYLRNIISSPGVVKKCHMSMNTLATVNLVKTNFFNAIGPYILELNMCAVPDLRKTDLIPAIKIMKNLRTIDVSFTNLDLADFQHIYEACPTITNVSLNFMLNMPSVISQGSVVQFRRMFKHFKQVHFVGSTTNLVSPELPSLLLHDADLDTLKYTIVKKDSIIKVLSIQQAKRPTNIKYKQFFVCTLDKSTIYDICSDIFFVHPDFSSMEAIILTTKSDFSSIKETCIYTTPIFRNYFQDTFDIDEYKINNIQEALDSEEYKINNTIINKTIVMVWKKEYYEFDKIFFAKLTNLLKPFFPCHCMNRNEKPISMKYDQFIISLDRANERYCESNVGSFKRSRTAPSMNTLNYDELFRNKERLELSLYFEPLVNPVTLPTNCDYLHKLTFISITGYVRYSADFFDLLFKSCVNLITANIESPPIFPCASPISKAIHLSPGLKNLRLMDRKIVFSTLFYGLAKCKTLENINVIELTQENVDIGDLSMIIQQCPDLYHLSIQAPMSKSMRMKKTKMLNKAKISCNKHYLNIEVQEYSKVSPFDHYDPFSDVYNLNSMKKIIKY